MHNEKTTAVNAVEDEEARCVQELCHIYDTQVLAEVYAEKQRLKEKVKRLEWSLEAGEETKELVLRWLNISLIPYIVILVLALFYLIMP